MKKYSCLQLFCILFSITVNAQPAPVVIKENHEKGVTKTTTIKNDGLGTETITVEYHKDGPPPKLEIKAVTTKNLLTGDSTKVISGYYDGYGEKEKNVTFITFKEGKTIMYSQKSYHKNGALQADNSWAEQPDGSVKFQKLNPKTGEYETTVKTKEEMQPFDSLKYIGKLYGMNQPEEKTCNPKIEIFGGFSYLNADFGNGSENLFGGHISIIYNISPRFGAGIDASLHTKKDGDFTISRSFILGEGVYTFGNVNNCDRKLSFDVHALIGLATETQKFKSGSFSSKSSGSGLAFGGGVGADLKLSEKLAVRLFQADYILTRFDGESFGNFRASTGLVLRIGDDRPPKPEYREGHKYMSPDDKY